MITIVLSDGTRITDVYKNGDNFIADFAIDEDTFKNKLSPVTIIEDEEETVHQHMRLVQIKQYGNEYWFVLSDISDEELKLMQIRADIDFIAMMEDIDL